jgi:hypothetical protein
MHARRIGEIKEIWNVENVANTGPLGIDWCLQTRAMHQVVHVEKSLVSTIQTDIDVSYNIIPSPK